jgi:hypothetical protein
MPRTKPLPIHDISVNVNQGEALTRAQRQATMRRAVRPTAPPAAVVPQRLLGLWEPTPLVLGYLVLSGLVLIAALIVLVLLWR